MDTGSDVNRATSLGMSSLYFAAQVEASMLASQLTFASPSTFKNEKSKRLRLIMLKIEESHFLSLCFSNLEVISFLWRGCQKLRVQTTDNMYFARLSL